MLAPRLKPWMLVSAIWLWPAVFGVVDRVIQGRLHGWDPASAADLLFQFWDWVAYALVTPAIFWASARWPVVGERMRRHFVVHLGFALLFCVVWALVGKLLQLTLGVLFERDALLRAISGAGPDLGLAVARNVASWIATTIPFGVVVYTTVAALAHAISYFAQVRDREFQLARLSEQLATARLGALQAQVNPHFLFNTLNTLVVLVRDGDRTGAVRIIELLSAVFRRTLRRDPGGESALGDELLLVRQYVAIEEARFPDRLRVKFDVAPGLDSAAIPSFALQHLVENAIRHGIARRSSAGHVWITSARDGGQLVMTVIDDGFGVTPDEPPAGHGIANTRDRLNAHYGPHASLTVEPRAEGGTVATLRIPYREVAPEATDASR